VLSPGAAEMIQRRRSIPVTIRAIHSIQNLYAGIGIVDTTEFTTSHLLRRTKKRFETAMVMPSGRAGDRKEKTRANFNDIPEVQICFSHQTLRGGPRT